MKLQHLPSLLTRRDSAGPAGSARRDEVMLSEDLGWPGRVCCTVYFAFCGGVFLLEHVGLISGYEHPYLPL